MCGIVGYFDYLKLNYTLSSKQFDPIIDRLRHRGPDGRGSHQAPGIGLGHRRLAILDLNMERARQPMPSPNNRTWITYNGELYNYLELRKELEDLGHPFTTTSDTEVLLHAWMQWGVDCLQRLNGIFAFAIWDADQKQLALARDPLGVKPLFYADTGSILAFASEVGPLLDFPFIRREPDYHGLDAAFTFGYTPAPLTGYKGVRQLLPGQLLVVKNGRVDFKKYWELPLEASKWTESEPELVEEFKRLLTQAVNRQMVSDVPIGAFLSGGADSFAVVQAMMQSGHEQVSAFTVGFPNPDFDELPFARLAANTLGANLIEQTVDLDPGQCLDRVAHHSQEPFCDSSSLPTWLLCQSAAQHVKVALGGDGADELLAGYSVYQADRQAARYRRLPTFLRKGVIAPLAHLIPDVGGKYTYSEKINRFLFGVEQGKYRDHSSWRVYLTSALKSHLYTTEFSKELKNFDAIELYADPIRRAMAAGCSPLDSCLYADLTFYLPNDMLVKVDRMSMAHSLEVRVPFLDVDFVNFCWRLPESLKMRGSTLKYILRKAIDPHRPVALRSLPKSGFNVPPGIIKNESLEMKNPFFKPVKLDRKKFFSRYHLFLCWYLDRIVGKIWNR